MSAIKSPVLERLEKAKAERDSRDPEAMKRDLEAKMNAADARHAATIEAVKASSHEEVEKAKEKAAEKKDKPAGAAGEECKE